MIENISENQLDKVLADNQLVIVDFFATWCGPCKMMEPVVSQCAQNHADIKFVKLNIDSSINSAMKHNVQVVPTFIAFKNGQEFNRCVGYNPLSEFDLFIQSLK